MAMQVRPVKRPRQTPGPLRIRLFAMPTLVTRTYLELGSPAELRAVPAPDPAPRVERVGDCPASFYRYLYGEVGRAFHWVDRLPWTDEMVREPPGDARAVALAAHLEGGARGYFELKPHDDASKEIAYFGLLPEYIGRGWGKWLLSEAVREAWAAKPRAGVAAHVPRDHPAALPNYLRRGFRAVREETYTVEA